MRFEVLTDWQERVHVEAESVEVTPTGDLCFWGDMPVAEGSIIAPVRGFAKGSWVSFEALK